MNFKENRFLWISVVLICFLDQATKLIIRQMMTEGQSISVLGNFFKISFVHNQNAAFGLPVQRLVPWIHGTVFYGFFMALAVVALVLFYRKTLARERFLRVALILILGGAVGNFIDRVTMGRVVDFLDFDFPDIYIASFKIAGLRFAGYAMDRWPTFNIADMAISCGITLLVAISLFKKHDKSS